MLAEVVDAVVGIYIPFDHDAANLFFQLVASRYEQGSVRPCDLVARHWLHTLRGPTDGHRSQGQVLAHTGHAPRPRPAIEIIPHQREGCPLEAEQKTALNRGQWVDPSDKTIVADYAYQWAAPRPHRPSTARNVASLARVPQSG